MAYKEREIEKRYWSIGQLAEILNVETSSIRFWLSEFDLTVGRSRGGERKFTAEDVEKMIEIHRLLKVEMYTTKGAKRQFEKNGPPLELREVPPARM